MPAVARLGGWCRVRRPEYVVPLLIRQLWITSGLCRHVCVRLPIMDEDAGPAGEHGGQPRDGLFRLVFGNPVHAASELRSVLPAGLLEQIDLTRLRAVPGSFVGPDLRQRHVDALFTTRWAGTDAYLYVLLEHQSTPDPLMAWRMLGYLMRIWERYVGRHPAAKRLPVVVPVVIYQGQRRWKASTEFADLFDIDPDQLASVVGVPRFSYLLDDLSGADPPVLAARPLTVEARVGLALLGLPTGFRDPHVALGQWRDVLAEVARHRGGHDVFAAFTAYLWEIK